MGYDEDELEMLIDNDYDLYKQKIEMFKNLWRKLKSGKFNKAQAPKLFSYLTDKAARKFNKEYPEDYNFTTQIRRKVDKDLVEEFLSAARNKEYDFMREGTVYSGKF